MAENISTPTIDSLMSELTQEVSDHWYKLGIFLSIPENELRSIEKKRYSNPRLVKMATLRMAAMLRYWLDTAPNPSWKVIIEAIEQLGNQRLAFHLIQNYQLSTPDVTDFSIIKEHIKQQGSVDVLSLKSYLIGPSRVGKTTTRRRLTGELKRKLSPGKIVPSTGIDAPLTVRLYRADVASTQSAALLSRSADAWQSQGLQEQFQTIYSYILYKMSSSRTSTTVVQDAEDAVTSLIVENGWEYVQKNTSLVDLDSLTFVNFIDIGGQPEFHELLPLLLHQGPAINLLFLNMTQSLGYKYQVIYEDQSGFSPIKYECEFSIEEIIQRTLNSISSLQPVVNHSKPAALLIGTHNDEDPRADLEQSIRDTFGSFIEEDILCSVSKPGEKPVKYVHPISNVRKEGSTSADSNTDIENLRERITTIVHDRFKHELVPTATLLLYLKLRTTYDPTPGWCSLEECIKIAASFGISRDDLTKEGGILQYLHDRFGTILYYRGLKIGKRVIVNPNVIMHPPAKLFMTAFGAKISQHATAEEIRRTGEIPHRLMEKVCSKSSQNKIPTDEIVELLKSRYILYENSEKKNYFLPCLLCPDNEEQSRDPGHLTSLTYPPILLIPETGYVPLGPFPATVVELSRSSHWTLAKSPRFRDRLRFYFLLPQEEPLDVEFLAFSTHLEFRFCHAASSKPINNPRLIPECRRELRECFDKVLSFYPHTRGRSWDFGFYCPNATQNLHPARCCSNDEPQAVICEQEDCVNRPIVLEDKHKCWFTEIPTERIQSSKSDYNDDAHKYKDPPTLDLLLEATTPVTDGWKILGIKLGLEEHGLAAICVSYNTSGVDVWKMHMFTKWLNKFNDASWDTVIKALKEMNYNAAAEIIENDRHRKSSVTAPLLNSVQEKMTPDREQDKMPLEGQSPKRQRDNVSSEGQLAPQTPVEMWECLIVIVSFLRTSQGAWTVVFFLLAVIIFYVLYH